jgi:succinoglycan biosynthesis protein ExoA
VRRPTVTIAIPVLNEEQAIDATLGTVSAQSYENVLEVLVVDGGSTDRTRELAVRHPAVRLLDNPGRIQSAGLNVALGEAKGEVFVRVDGHCSLAPDYVQRCVDALAETGAAMVGGAMKPVGDGWLQRGVAAAMSSPLGAGPAHFHVGDGSGWVDTVYLGAFRTQAGRDLGGYAEDVGVNEDAELAHRMRMHGGVWFDERIRSTYVPRSTPRAVVRQFYRYGRSRAATVRKHPDSLAPRQLAAPGLVLGLLTPWRRRVLGAYGVIIAVAVADQARNDPGAAAGLAVTLPAMHLPWGVGFLTGLLRPVGSPTE